MQYRLQFKEQIYKEKFMHPLKVFQFLCGKMEFINPLTVIGGYTKVCRNFVILFFGYIIRFLDNIHNTDIEGSFGTGITYSLIRIWTIISHIGRDTALKHI